MLSAHNKLADALSEARNHDAPIAHGKDGFLDALTNDHLRLYLLTGDTILSLLLGALDGSEPNLIHTREPYERFEHFNSAIDALVGVEALVDYDDGVVVLRFKTPSLREGMELRVEPSRLLYGLDRAAYVEVLESLPSTFEVERGGEEASAKEAPALPALVTAAKSPVRAPIIKSYTGRYASLKAGLERFLSDQGVPSAAAERVLDSLLAAFDELAVLDWTLRDSMRARVMVALKRVLKTAGPKHPPAEKLAAAVMQWLMDNEPPESTGRRKKATKGAKRAQV